MSNATYQFGDEIAVEPLTKRQLAQLLEQRGFTTVGLQARSNSAALRLGVVQYVAHHGGTVLRYGYVLRASAEPGGLVRFWHELGFSNKYDEPILVQLKPDAAEELVRAVGDAKGRDGVQGWVRALPQAGKRPVEYADAPSDWPIVKVRVEPTYATVGTVMCVDLMGFWAALSWGRVLMGERRGLSDDIAHA